MSFATGLVRSSSASSRMQLFAVRCRFISISRKGWEENWSASLNRGAVGLTCHVAPNGEAGGTRTENADVATDSRQRADEVDGDGEVDRVRITRHQGFTQRHSVDSEIDAFVGRRRDREHDQSPPVFQPNREGVEKVARTGS